MKIIFRCLAHGKIFLKAQDLFLLKKETKEEFSQEAMTGNFLTIHSPIAPKPFCPKLFLFCSMPRNSPFLDPISLRNRREEHLPDLGRLKNCLVYSQKYPTGALKERKLMKGDNPFIAEPWWSLALSVQRSQQADLISWAQCAMIHPILHAFCSRVSLWTAAQHGKKKADVTWFAKRRKEDTGSYEPDQSLKRWWSASFCRRSLSMWRTGRSSGAVSMNALEGNHARPTWLPSTMKQLPALQHECMHCSIHWAAFEDSWSHSSRFDLSTASESDTQVGWRHC